MKTLATNHGTDRSFTAAFIVLHFDKDPDAQGLQCLTPHIMQWSERTWIFDLRPCLRYWHRQAAESQSSLNVLIRLSLNRLCADDGFRAVISPHPLQGALALEVMKERGLVGLIDLSDPIGNNLFRQLGWNHWWNTIDTLKSHLKEVPLGPRPFKVEPFNTQCRRMRQTCARMSFKNPHALTSLESASLTRRFGSQLGRFINIALSRTPPDSGSFPWRPHQFKQSTKISRHLDFPLTEWEHLRALLAEDYDRLCALPSFDKRSHVLRMHWHLTLTDMSERIVPIIFRHPHSLHSEKGSHKTALLQSQFAFLANVPQDDDDPQYLMGVNSWRLEISEEIFLQSHSVGLFGDTDADVDSMIKLENQLPVALEQFDLCTHWQPELSFRHNSAPSTDLFLESSLSALKAVAADRPLFLLTKPTPLNRQGQSSLWRFLERTMTEWWQTSSPKNILRDYYQYVDHNGRCYWVYKDTMERWYVHGIFA